MKKKKEFDERDIEQLHVMGAIRQPLEEIWQVLGFSSRSTFERALKKNDKARESLELGRASASAKVRRTLFRMATESNETIVEYPKTVWEVDPDTGNRVAREELAIEKTIRGPDFNALKLWCQTQEGFRITERIELARPEEKEINQLTEEQILDRIRKLELTAGQ